MSGGLFRIWLVACSVAVGTLHGCGRPARWHFVAVAMAGGLLLLSRRGLLVLAGSIVAALGLGTFGASLRCVEQGLITDLASHVPACELDGRILESAGGLGTLVAVESIECDGFGAVRGGGAVIVDDVQLHAGTRVRATGWLLPLGSEGFDLARRRLGAHASFDAHLRVTSSPSGAHSVAAAVRIGLAGATEGIDERRGALLEGLTIGATERLDHATLESFRAAGLSHLLAVSGSNVALVLGAVALCAASMSLRLRVMLGAGVLGTFVLVVGPEPSVLRAALMGGIALAALAWGDKAEPLHALGLAVTLLVVARPGMLFSVGLHLSVAATGGIVLWSGGVASRLERLPRPLALALAATVAAQFAVAPIIAGVFGELSLVAPVANLLAFAAVGPATVLGLGAAVLGALSPAAGAPVAWAAQPFAGWILFVGDLLGRPAWASVEVPRAAGWVLALPVAVALWWTIRTDPRFTPGPRVTPGG